MRRTLRQLAAIKPPRYLEPGAPTGLTGLLTHHAPQATLSSLYRSTLSVLKQLPEASLYRQSAEAVTKHRQAIVEAIEPEGMGEWREIKKKFDAQSAKDLETGVKELTEKIQNFKGLETAKKIEIIAQEGSFGTKEQIKEGETETIELYEKRMDTELELFKKSIKAGLVGSDTTMQVSFEPLDPFGEPDDRVEEYNGEGLEPMFPEGGRAIKGGRWEADIKRSQFFGKNQKFYDGLKRIPPPLLTADQIGEIENKIGAGLIEEVIQVAEGELKLAKVMLESKVWEDLEEKPKEGQWTYFGRSHN